MYPTEAFQEEIVGRDRKMSMIQTRPADERKGSVILRRLSVLKSTLQQAASQLPIPLFRHGGISENRIIPTISDSEKSCDASTHDTSKIEDPEAAPLIVQPTGSLAAASSSGSTVHALAQSSVSSVAFGFGGSPPAMSALEAARERHKQQQQQQQQMQVSAFKKDGDEEEEASR